MAWVTKSSPEQWQPEPQRQYTGREKAANWWHYRKWWVLGGALLLLAAVWTVRALTARTEPDAYVGIVAPQEIDEEALAPLRQTLTALCPDANGDGQVLVEVEQYALDFGRDPRPEEMETRMGTVTRLTGSIYAAGGAYLFILADPEGFQKMTGALCYADGAVPVPDNGYDAANWQRMVLPVTDTPLAGGPCDGLYLARAALGEQAGPAQAAAADALWQALCGQ